MDRTLGFIGLGAMGSPIAVRLLHSGYRLRVFDPDTRPVDALVASGATGCASPLDVATGSQVVFACLPSPQVSLAVALGDDGVGHADGLEIYVEMSTIGTAALESIAAGLNERGISVVDAPVSGGPRGVQAGTLSVMASGDPAAVDTVTTILNSLTERIFYVGTEPGLGQLTKLANNLVSAAGMAAACEASALAVKAGVDARTLIEVINASTGRNSATLDKFPQSILPRTFDYGGKLSTMYKDVSLCLEEARRREVPMWVGANVVQLWNHAMTQGRADDDYTTLMKMIEEWAGVTVGAEAEHLPPQGESKGEPAVSNRLVERGDRWKGWSDLPQRDPDRPTGNWVDLSHCLDDRLPHVPALPSPSFERLWRLSEGRPNVTEIRMASHVGTHVDTPCHFIVDGPAAEQVPLERLCGSGVVWKVDAESLGEIGVRDLERSRPLMRRGDIVLISTGWGRRSGTPAYDDHPALSTAAADWLVEQQAKMVGVDFSTPDLAVHHRPADFLWPVHQILLSHGVLIAEHLTNLEALENRRIEAMFQGLNVRGADGMPTRAIARTVESI